MPTLWVAGWLADNEASPDWMLSAAAAARLTQFLREESLLRSWQFSASQGLARILCHPTFRFRIRRNPETCCAEPDEFGPRHPVLFHCPFLISRLRLDFPSGLFRVPHMNPVCIWVIRRCVGLSEQNIRCRCKNFKQILWKMLWDAVICSSSPSFRHYIKSECLLLVACPSFQPDDTSPHHLILFILGQFSY